MARTTLDALLRLRRLAVDEAARALGAALRQEEQVRQVLARLDNALAHECKVTRAQATEDPVTSPFAAWGARTRQEMARVRTQLVATSQAVVAAQDALGEARGGLRALETAIARDQAEDAMTAARSAQHTLDDVARRPTQGADG
jgi:flagellar export protein FliJ